MKVFLSITLAIGISFFTSLELGATIYEFTEGNQVELIRDPLEGVREKIQLVRAAKHHIHIVTYFWDDSKFPLELARELKSANQRGVEVRILSSHIPSVSTDIFGKGRKILKSPQAKTPFVFLTLRPAMGFTMYHNIHEKIFLIDGQEAIVGGRNISDSSLHGKDLEIKVKGPLVNQLQLHFHKLFNFVSILEVQEECRKRLDCHKKHEAFRFSYNNSKYYPVIKPKRGGVRSRLITHDVLMNYKKKKYTKEQRLTQSDDIINVITSVKFNKLIGYAYFMTLSSPFIKFLNRNLKKEKEISFITNSIESAKFSSNKGYIYSLPIAKDLVSNGLELYQWERNQKLNYVHEKLLIFDDDHIFVGSHNFGTGSTTVSNEIMIEFFSKEIADELKEEFSQEIDNTNITTRASTESLMNEIYQHQKLIKFLNRDSVSKVLNEIY